MNEEALYKIQDKMKEFYTKSGGRIPNAIILPPQFVLENKSVFSEVTGLKIIYGAVDDPIVCMI